MLDGDRDNVPALLGQVMFADILCCDHTGWIPLISSSALDIQRLGYLDAFNHCRN